jgi:hypothetical protein
LSHAQTYYAPMRLCFLDTICQARVIKSEMIETDIEVFRNLRDEYHRALNPFSRLVPSLLPTKIRVKIERLRVSKLIAGSFQKACVALWVRICPVFRKCSLWDLKEIREAKVMNTYAGSDAVRSSFSMHTTRKRSKPTSSTSSKSPIF